MDVLFYDVIQISNRKKTSKIILKIIDLFFLKNMVYILEKKNSKKKLVLTFKRITLNSIYIRLTHMLILITRIKRNKRTLRRPNLHIIYFRLESFSPRRRRTPPTATFVDKSSSTFCKIQHSRQRTRWHYGIIIYDNNIHYLYINTLVYAVADVSR